MGSIDGFKICKEPDVCLNKLVQNDALAVAVSHEYIRHNLANLTDKIYCFDKSESLHSYGLTFLMRRNFVFSKQLNLFIRASITGGLMEKWRHDNYIRSRRKQKEKVLNQLIMAHSYGMLMIALALTVLAVSFLILEIIVHIRARKRSNNGLWIKIERLIDPNRHFMVENVRFNCCSNFQNANHLCKWIHFPKTKNIERKHLFLHHKVNLEKKSLMIVSWALCIQFLLLKKYNKYPLIIWIDKF